MTLHAARRGAAVAGLWLVLAGAAVLFLAASPGWGAMLTGIWAVIVFGGLVPRFSSAKIYVGRHHVSARWGILFPSVRRFPRRFVTGVHILETPLCRLAGVCVIMLSSSGAFLILPGFPTKQAQLIAHALTVEEARK